MNKVDYAKDGLNDARKRVFGRGWYRPRDYHSGDGIVIAVLAALTLVLWFVPIIAPILGSALMVIIAGVYVWSISEQFWLRRQDVKNAEAKLDQAIQDQRDEDLARSIRRSLGYS